MKYRTHLMEFILRITFLRMIIFFLQHHSIHLKLSLTRKNRETVISFENTWSLELSNPTSTKIMPQALLTVGGGANVKLRSNHKSYSDGNSLNEMTVKLTNFVFVFLLPVPSYTNES